MNIFVTKSLYLFLCLTIIITITIFLTEQLFIQNYINMNILTDQEKDNKIINYNLDKNIYSPVNKNNNYINSINCNNLSYIYSRGNNNTYINYE